MDKIDFWVETKLWIKEMSFLSEKISNVQVFMQFCFRFNYILAEDKNYFWMSDDPAHPFLCCSTTCSIALISIVLTKPPKSKRNRLI